MNESGWISNSAAEKAEKQYLVLIQNKDFIKAAGKFDIIKDRVDDFWMKILDSASTLDLENIVRIVMILSHGNARVESGFSINDDMLLPNMLSESIIAQRIMYEDVSKAGGAADVDITKEMMRKV